MLVVEPPLLGRQVSCKPLREGRQKAAQRGGGYAGRLDVLEEHVELGADEQAGAQACPVARGRVAVQDLGEGGERCRDAGLLGGDAEACQALLERAGGGARVGDDEDASRVGAPAGHF